MIFPECVRKNGEEILTSDPPLIRYAAGILYPRQTSMSVIEHSTDEDNEDTVEKTTDDNTFDSNNNISEPGEELTGTKNEYLEDAEELLLICQMHIDSLL